MIVCLLSVLWFSHTHNEVTFKIRQIKQGPAKAGPGLKRHCSLWERQLQRPPVHLLILPCFNSGFSFSIAIHMVPYVPGMAALRCIQSLAQWEECHMSYSGVNVRR